MLLFITAATPYNMDEFIHYNAILSSLPGNNIVYYSNPYKLNFLNTGLILPLRAFDYAGSFPALYYYPIYLIWNSPLSARALGLVFLCTGAFFAARTFRLSFKYVALGLLFLFPYVYQHAVDTGPVGLHILSIYVIYVFMDRWLGTLHMRYISAITVLIFLCIWTKLSYFWMTPGIFIFFLLHVGRHRKYLCSRKNIFRLSTQSAVAAVALIVLVGSLLLSTSPVNSFVQPLLGELRASRSHTLPDLWNGAWKQSWIVGALMHPLEATQRTFLFAAPGLVERLYSMMLYLFVPVTLILLFIRSFWRDDYPHRKALLRSLILPLILYIAFLVTVVMIIRTVNAGLMHHAILSLPFLVLAILATMRCVLDSHLPKLLVQRTLSAVCIVFIGINLYFFAAFPSQQLHPSEHTSKLLAHRIMNTGTIPERFTILIIDWGAYFYEGLYGSSQKSTLMVDGLHDPNLLKEIRDEVRQHGRKLIVMFINDQGDVNLQHIQSDDVRLRRCNGMPNEAMTWQILYEPDREMQTVCDSYKKVAQSSSPRKMLLRASLLY